jgi:hypothetical protein
MCCSVVLIDEREIMDYKLCTVEELAEFVIISPVSRITQQLGHYRRKGNEEMVDKILEARRLAKKKKLEAQLEAMQ